MKVNLSYQQLAEAEQAFQQIEGHPLNTTVSWAMGRTSDFVSQGLSRAKKDREKLVRRYSEIDENGKPMVDERGQIVFADKENGKSEFLREQEELYKKTTEIRAHALPLDKMLALNIKLPPGIMLAIDFMLTGVGAKLTPMDVTYNELVMANAALQFMRNQGLPVPISYKFGQAMKQIQAAKDPMDEKRQTIVSAYSAKDEKGRDKVESDGEIVFKDGEAGREAFVKEQELLLDEVVTLAVPTIDLSELEEHEVALVPRVMRACGFMFTGFDSDEDDDEAEDAEVVETDGEGGAS